MATTRKTISRRWGDHFFEAPFVDLRPYFPEPTYKRGEWEINRFTLDKTTVRMEQLRDMMHGRTLETRFLEWDHIYLRLWHPRHGVVMSTTPMELMTNREVVERARGRVLVVGLGLGVVTMAVQRKPEVSSVLVVEREPDVIGLIKSRLPLDGKVQIVQADIKTWKPPRGARFNAIYFDIWTGVTQDNLPEMALLHRRFARYKAPGGWMGSWRQKDLQRERRRGGW